MIPFKKPALIGRRCTILPPYYHHRRRRLSTRSIPRDGYLVLDFVRAEFSVVGEQIPVTPPTRTAAVDLRHNHVLTRTEVCVPLQRELVHRQVRPGSGVPVVRDTHAGEVPTVVMAEYVKRSRHVQSLTCLPVTGT